MTAIKCALNKSALVCSNAFTTAQTQGWGDLTTKLRPTVGAFDTKKMKMSNARGYARPPPGRGKH